MLVLVSGLAFGQPGNCGSMVNEALELSGFIHDIEFQGANANVPEFIQAVIASWHLPPNSSTVVQQALRKGFDPATVKAALGALIGAKCKPEHMQQVIQQLRLPLLAKMTSLENAVKSPQGQNELVQFLKMHPQEMAGLPRLAALQTLDRSLGMADFTAKLNLAVQSGMADGLGIRGAKNIKATYVGSWAKAQIGGSALEVSLYTYRSVDDKDLNDYVHILTSEPIKSFYTTVMESMLVVNEQRAKIVGEEIRNNLPPGSISPAAISLGAAGKKR